MIRIIEIGTTDISYKMQFIDNDTGKITNESVVKCKSVKVNKNGIFYYVLFDRDFKIMAKHIVIFFFALFVKAICI